MNWAAEADVICIGGGISGLVCGARAAELGLRVIVLERGADESYACNSRYSAGVFHASYLDVTLAQPELEAAMRKATAGQGDDALIVAIATHAARALEWLRQQGGKFIRGPQRSWVMAPPRGMSTGLDWKGRGPDALLRQLTQRITERQGRIMLGTQAGNLVMDGTKLKGVKAKCGDAELQIAAPAVLIADGGFQANFDLFRAHIGPHPDRVFQRNAGTAFGDGLKMALEAGAAYTRLDRFYGHLLSRDVFQNAELWPFPQLDAPAAAAILVDPDGRRLFDEGLGGIFLSNEIAKMDDPLSTTVVCDAKIWDVAGREHQVPPNPLLEKHGGTLHRADTIEQLAEKAGLFAEGLAESVRTYNAWVDSAGQNPLSPSRTAAKTKPQPIRHPPFMAIPVCSGITNTMGGIKIDAHARAIDMAGAVIPGLYCAGAALGGLEGGDNVGYVGGLIKSVFGLRAAEHMAESFIPEKAAGRAAAS